MIDVYRQKKNRVACEQPTFHSCSPLMRSGKPESLYNFLKAMQQKEACYTTI